MRLLVSLLIAGTVYGQTAITALSSFWEMDVDPVSQIAWDAKGNRHAKYVGRGAGLELPATIFNNGVKINYNNGNAGVAVPISLLGTSGTFCFGSWVRHAGSAVLISRNTGNANESWTMNFNATSGGRLQMGGVLMASGNAVAQNTNVLVWACYDEGANQIKLAINAGAWTNGTPAASFQAYPNAPLHFAGSRQQFGAGATVGRTMYWEGYIPTDAERTAIYNGGAGRDITYFVPAGFTPLPPPVSFTLVNPNLISDQPLTVSGVTTPGLSEQGLYYIRPWKLRAYSTSLANANGDYVWYRSTDHTGGAGGIWQGFSIGPTVVPASWTKILDDNSPQPVGDWSGCETPFLVYNDQTNVFHMFMHCVLKGSPYPYQQTSHVFTSPDLVTWTWRGIAFPNYLDSPANTYNHTGYGVVRKNGTNDWSALSLIRDGTVSCGAALCGSILGVWSSTDGINWTFVRETTGLEPTLSGNGYIGKFRWYTFGSGFLGNVNNTRTMYVGRESATPYVMSWPPYSSFEHDGTGTNPDWLQHVSIYEEGGTVYAYAKWAYQQTANSHIKLYVGATVGNTVSLSKPRSRLHTNIRVSGGAVIQ